ncbi:MAG: 3-hydroxybutyryl-CoA dehydrogenase [Mycobacteriales bacterium]
MTTKLNAVGVVGLGTMGAGIAEVFARTGIGVVGVEPEPAALERGRGQVERSTGRAVSRGRMSEDDQRSLIGRISFSSSLDDLDDVDLVIEAVPERMDIKADLFGRLDAICRPDTILATNTSSLSITEIAATTTRPSKVVGMHFFNPAPVMRLVEVIHGIGTEAAVVGTVEALARELGKTPVAVADRAGFVANALLLPYLNRAVRLYGSGRASREHIDTAMQVGAGLPMGPLTLLDMVGLDTSLHVLDRMYDETRDRRHAPAPLLRQLVAAGHVGRKVGRGFYSYDGPGSRTVVAETSDPAAAQGNPPPQVTIAGGSGAVAAVCERAGVQIADGASLTVHVATGRAPLAAGAIGLHLLGPAGAPVLAEVVAGRTAAADATAGVRAICVAAELSAIVTRDRAGYLFDALLLPHLGDAVAMVDDGYATEADVDRAMTLGCGYPAGPIAMLRARGAADVLAGLARIAEETGEPGDRPSPLLVEWATA